MLFSQPCCDALRRCLEDRGDRTFRRFNGDTGPLMVRTLSRLQDTPGGRERQIQEQGVNFCPFCGTRLQTAEAVQRYFKNSHH